MTEKSTNPRVKLTCPCLGKPRHGQSEFDTRVSWYLSHHRTIDVDSISLPAHLNGRRHWRAVTYMPKISSFVTLKPEPPHHPIRYVYNRKIQLPFKRITWYNFFPIRMTFLLLYRQAHGHIYYTISQFSLSMTFETLGGCLHKEWPFNCSQNSLFRLRKMSFMSCLIIDHPYLAKYFQILDILLDFEGKYYHFYFIIIIKRNDVIEYRPCDARRHLY